MDVFRTAYEYMTLFPKIAMHSLFYYENSRQNNNTTLALNVD